MIFISAIVTIIVGLILAVSGGFLALAVERVRDWMICVSIAVVGVGLIISGLYTAGARLW